jgi:hypothetical protein
MSDLLRGFAEKLQQANPFANIQRPPTGGAIVPYKPPTTAITPYVPPTSTIRINPVPIAPRVPAPSPGTTLQRIGSATADLPLPKTWAAATRAPSGLTPKVNLPLIGKLNQALARGPALTSAVSRSTGILSKIGGGLKKFGRFGTRLLGPVGWISAGVDLMQFVKDTWFSTQQPSTWSGGQCQTNYSLDFSYGETGYPRTDWISQGLYPGPITFWGRRGNEAWVSGPRIYLIYNKPSLSYIRDIRVLQTLTPYKNPAFRVRRTDNLPDDCGDPPPVIILDRGNPTIQPNPDLPVPVPVRPRLPTVPNPPRLPGGRRYQPTRPRNPTPVIPIPFPVPIPDLPRPVPPPEVKPGECDPCEGIEWIVKELDRQRKDKEKEPQPTQPVTYRLDVPYAVCTETTDSEGKTVKEGKIQYFAFQVSQIPNGWRDIFTASALLGAKGCECDHGEPVASIPDWWQVRLGAERPQLVIIYRLGTTQNYWQLAIPHPAIIQPPEQSPLPAYTKGNWQGQIILTDNSKFTVNANSRAEAEKVINAARNFIQGGRLGTNPAIYYGERKGRAVKEGAMTPIRADYYPTGQKDVKPAWRKRFAAPG